MSLSIFFRVFYDDFLVMDDRSADIVDWLRFFREAGSSFISSFLSKAADTVKLMGDLSPFSSCFGDCFRLTAVEKEDS